MKRFIIAIALLLAPIGAAAQALSAGGALGPVPQQGYLRVFQSSGAGTLPSGCQSLNLTLMGGGQSGAPGGTIAAGQSGSGGGSGGSGALLLFRNVSVSTLPTLGYTVTIGAGGAAPLAGSAANSGGNSFISFGATTFSVFGGSATGPTAGIQGATSSGGIGGNNVMAINAGGVVQNTFWAATGGQGSSATGVPGAANSSVGAPGVAGAGGGLNAGVFQQGGNSGYAWYTNAAQVQFGGQTDGAAGGVTPPPSNFPLLSEGGAGGAGSAAGTGGAGSAGYNGGGGGGGGSGPLGGGAGGAGGNGYVVVECH